MQASHPDVYAMGDVATFPLQLTGGTPARQEHVNCCRQTATYVANQLASPGGPAFDYLPFFYSRVFSLSWQVRRCWIVVDGGRLAGARAFLDLLQVFLCTEWHCTCLPLLGDVQLLFA